MKILNKPMFFLLTKLMALIASIFLAGKTKADINYWIISALSFACIFLAELLIDRYLHRKKFILLINLITMTACFWMGLDVLYPLYIATLLHLLEITTEGSLYYQILLVAVILSFLIMTPTGTSLVLCFIFIMYVLLGRIILDKLFLFEKMNEAQKETIHDMEKKLADLRELIKTLKYTTSLEERHRIAERLHDKVGHGISGSIIMLEAAMLILKNQPEKAAESIQKAITNLREGVDDIRKALREERADRYLLGMKDIQILIDEFKVNYNKAAQIKTSGDVSRISLEIWACIHDNLKECLTNVIKHSNATEFILSIEVYKKVIKVEYKDNGKSDETLIKDMGLEAIEERTLKTKGRCFFRKGEEGFCVTNIFPFE